MKKIIGLLLVMLIMFSLVGCKSKGNINVDEEIVFTAGEESQVDIQENIGANEQEQKGEEKEDTVKDKQIDISNEKTDAPDDTVSNNIVVENNVTSTQQNEETNIEIQDNKGALNQLEYERQKLETCSGKPFANFRFSCISDMINTLKTREYIATDSEKAEMEEACSTLSNQKEKEEILLKFGTKEDIRFNTFKTDSIEKFYKIKDIPGYTLSDIYLREKDISYIYSPIGKEKVTNEDKIKVAYLRPEDFVTDSYFDDYIEYHKIKEKKGRILDKNDSVGGFLYGDDFLYNKYEGDDYAIIMFPVENTIIEIIAYGETANYEALKKLCVAEKVVVK